MSFYHESRHNKNVTVIMSLLETSMIEKNWYRKGITNVMVENVTISYMNFICELCMYLLSKMCYPNFPYV